MSYAPFLAVGVDIGTRRYHAVAMTINERGGASSVAGWDYETDRVSGSRWIELDDLYQQFYEDLYLRVDPAYPTFVYIEDPVVGRGGAKVQGDLARAQASMLLAAAHVNERSPTIPYTIHLTSWKKEVVGKGNASKKVVAEYVRENWPRFAAAFDGEQDYYDARCIAQYATLVQLRAQEIEGAETLADIVPFPKRG